MAEWKNSKDFPRVEKTVRGFKVTMWHPQWGGYSGVCEVEFSDEVGCGDVPGCFEVGVYHDGEFPTDAITTEYHYCDALQVVSFGLTVYEKQLALQKGAKGEAPVKPEIERLTALRDRINAMIEGKREGT